MMFVIFIFHLPFKTHMTALIIVYEWPMPSKDSDKEWEIEAMRLKLQTSLTK
jgi:hypothetical protein